MVGAGLLARNAVERGLDAQALGEDLAGAGLDRRHRLPRAGRPRPSTSTRSSSTSSATAARPASATPARCRRRSRRRSTRRTSRSARCSPATATSRAGSTRTCKANYLASPPLVVAYALAGRMDIDLTSEPLGEGSDGEPVYLRDIWPDAEEIKELVGELGRLGDVHPQLRRGVRRATRRWNAVEVPEGDRYTWPDSTYVRRPRFFEGMPAEAPGVEPIAGARVLALLGDSITTDHISPAGRDQEGQPRRALADRAGRRAAATSTPTARAAATTR